jgi:hypothetical protein
MHTATVHISIMTGKLDGLRAISTNTRTNEYCIKQNASGDPDNICTKCYSHTMLSSYRKNMQPALQRNSAALSQRMLADAEMPRILDAVFRFDAHGDIVSKHFRTQAKPANLILIYSNPKISNIMKRPPKHFDRTFNNVLEHEHVDRQNCTGQKCADCLLCYTPVAANGVTTIVEKVKKY